MKATLALALGASMVCGCSEQVLCPALLGAGVDVEVRDSVTGAFAASGAKLVAVAGAYADSSSIPAGQPDDDAAHLRAAFRAGVYAVTVTKAGYADWVKDNVAVTPARCGINKVSLTALLQRAP